MKISDIVALGLWPDSKKTTSQKGISELEDLGYNLFYIGKNADLYTCPGEDAKVLLVRSDRCSVFDIPLNLLIDGKGVSQTAISNNGAEFAKEAGIRTAILSEKVDQSLAIAPRWQLMEICKPLDDACQNGDDPYGLNLPSDLPQWSKFETPIFTPTTKGIKDEPLNSEKVRIKFPEIVTSLEKLFKDFTAFAEARGIIVVDTKFEIFVNSKGEWVLGDEVLTPESSRFISKEDFDAANYISMDKLLLRDFGKANNWKEKSKDLKPGEKLEVNVPQTIKDKILSGYTTILNRLSK